jgi:predicted O-methyltransferase YrrM
LNLKGILKNLIARIFPVSVAQDKSFFRLWERKGFHITPVSYEEPIPDTATLKDDLWQRQSELVGIDLNEQGQIDLLSLFSSRFREEYESFPRNKTLVPYQYYVNNGTFESVDGEIYYCMVRYFKPKRIFEIGSGNSTYLSAQALLKNKDEDNHKCELIAIEPYPNNVLKAGFPGLTKLMSEKVQNIPISEFSKIGENDILFVDSSHALKIGSDVQCEILEILPRLNEGAIVHIHDIFFPAEYPKNWVLEDFRFLNEQYLLQAFLAFNKSFEVLWAGSYMHLHHPNKLGAAFSSYSREKPWPGSFWIRKIK